MNEFWSIVLGAALATVGGIVASFVAMWIKSIESKKDQKKECYSTLLSFCLDLRNYEISKRSATYKSLGDAITTAQLYASSKIYELFIDFVETARIYIDKVEKNESVDAETVEMAKKYSTILSQIKKELNLSTTKPKKQEHN
ncbi:MAG: hypothetical protein J6R61_03990 [Bacteroidales bacterium]|nr:hypothetical protein [Bacteroidales bacterium]MBO7273408.1 hypothetical protein [Clostridia bacterium]